MVSPTNITGLYVIIDPDVCDDRPPDEIARLALKGGARTIQWRDKHRAKGDQIADARAIARACAQFGAVFLINDHPDLVAATGADGVHLGQRDLPLDEARAILGPGAVIGVSTNNVAEAQEAQRGGASYVAVGAIFPTSTKADTRAADLDRIRAIKAAVDLPIVAIGGIDTSNIGAVVEVGADAAAVISAVCSADDPAAAAAELASAFPDPGQARREELRAVIARYVDCLTSRDRQAFLSLFTTDGTIQDPADAAPYIGQEEIARWWDSVVTPNDNYRVRLDSTYIAGEEAAITWTVTHRHGDVVHEDRGIDILSFHGGLIESCHSFWVRDDQSQTARRNLVNEYTRALNERDKAAYLGLFSEDAVQQEPVGTPPRIGLAAISAWWDSRMAVYSSYQLRTDIVCGAGAETAISWTLAAEIDGVAMDGEGVDIVTLDGTGRITSVHSYWESDGVPFPSVARERFVVSHGKLARRFVDTLNQRDREAFLNLFTADSVVQVPHHDEPYLGREGLASWWDATIPGRPFNIRLNGVYVTIDEMALVWTNVDDTPGSTTSIRGIEILTVDGGRLSSVNSFRTMATEPDPRPRAVAYAFTDALNARDRAAFLALWSKDGMRQDRPDMIPVIGIEAIGKAFDEMLLQFPDYTMHITDICVSGNEAAIAWRTENRAGAVPPVVEGVVLLELDAEGKIAAQHSYYELR